MKKRLVENQKVHEETGHGKTINGPYHKWVERKGLSDSGSIQNEPTSANPDLLTDTPENRVWGSQFSIQLAELIVERFSDGNGNFPILSKRQNQVLRLKLIGLSDTDVAKELRIDQRNVVTYLSRIRSKFQRLLKSTDL